MKKPVYREINEHKVVGDFMAKGDAVKELDVYSVDAPGAGGANHLYLIQRFNTETNASCNELETHEGLTSLPIIFQNGPIPEKGANGVTMEALLAIVADRLEGFQKGQWPCNENEDAYCLVMQALNVLKDRTLDRMERGVEGKDQA